MPALLRPRYRPAVWIALGLLLLGLVAAGSLMPARGLPSMPVAGLDKLQHVLGHGLLSAYAAMLLAPARARLAASIGLLLYGIGIEAAQGLLTASREADAFDVLANAAGIVLGQCVAATPLVRMVQSIDARLRA